MNHRKAWLAASSSIGLIIVATHFISLSTSRPVVHTLPQDWFAKHVAATSKPYSMQGPLREAWRYDAPDRVGGTAVCGEKHVYITKHSMGQSAGKPGNLAQNIPSVTLCKDLASGKTLWEVNNLGAIYPVDSLVFSTSKRKLSLLDANTGRTVRAFAHVLPGPLPAHALQPGVSPTRYFAINERSAAITVQQATTETTTPVPLNPAQWNDQDANGLLNLLKCAYIPKHGVCKWAMFPSHTDMLLYDQIKHTLTLEDVDTNRVHWQTPAIGDDTLLWNPPIVAQYSSSNSVTAYDVQSGKPVWRYPFRTSIFGGAPVRLLGAIEDGVFLLTDPPVDTGPMVTKDPQTGRASVTDQRNLWLTRLDMNGKLLFEQPLNIVPFYCGYGISGPYLVVWNGFGTVVCYESTDGPKTISAPSSTMPSEETNRRIADLHDLYSKTPNTLERRQVCTELGKLGDLSLTERVLDDYANCPANQRMDYMAMLGGLHDNRAVPTIIELLLDKPATPAEAIFQQKARTALNQITGIDALLIDADTLRAWWTAHRHLYEPSSTSNPS